MGTSNTVQQIVSVIPQSSVTHPYLIKRYLDRHKPISWVTIRITQWKPRRSDRPTKTRPSTHPDRNRRVRSMESYALVKHSYNGICFFRANSCSRRITNIMSVVERFGRKPLSSSGRIPTRPQYSLGWRATIFSSIVPAGATS